MAADQERRGTAGGDLVLRDGRRVGVRVFGAREGFPVIGLHGMPGSRLMYATVAQAAARRGIRLIAVDRPGLGPRFRRVVFSDRLVLGRTISHFLLDHLPAFHQVASANFGCAESISIFD